MEASHISRRTILEFVWVSWFSKRKKKPSGGLISAEREEDGEEKRKNHPHTQGLENMVCCGLNERNRDPHIVEMLNSGVSLWDTSILFDDQFHRKGHFRAKPAVPP